MASRILLADDSITIQKVVNLTFADEGIEVVAVSNGDLAERRLSEVNPDLVLADIFMPGKNGYELCEAIKENAQFGNVPVVLLVGAFEPFDQAEARRVRADAHLTKPFESRTLVETVRRLISATPRSTTGPIAPMRSAGDYTNESLDPQAATAPAAPLASALAGKLDLSAMMDDGSPAESASVARNTGELASPAPEAHPDATDLGFADAAPGEASSATLTDTSERYDPLEFSPDASFSSGDMTVAFGFDAPMIQDFDTSQPAETAAFQDPISFGAEPNAELGVQGVDAGNGDDWFNRNALDTTSLDRTPDDGPWQPPAAGAPLGYQSPDFKPQTEAGFSASEGSTETACATLLAVDEPLGDVLSDEAVSVDQLTLARRESGDSLGFEFMDEQVAKSLEAASTQFDLVETVADSAPTTPSVYEEGTFAGEPVAAQETPAPDAWREEATSQSPEAQPVSHDVADWTTPGAAAYSTAELDSAVMHVDPDEPLADQAIADEPQSESLAETGFTSLGGTNVQDAPRPEGVDAGDVTPLPEGSVGGATQPESEEASFTTPATWTEEEARFSPIDIEAVTVEEPSTGEVGAAETGFAFAEAPGEQPTASIQTPAAIGANGHAGEAAGAELSSSAIEQIVRRVVAEMSESVVREVAWEVVPDCVERVIEQLTRESLSKRA